MLTPGQRLREAWTQQTLAIPGVFCPLLARMAERMGFRAVYLSGAALSATLGLPDIGLLTAHDFAETARAITSLSSLPLLCDADTGFGEALQVERTVKQYEAAGAAGLHLEDQQLPKRCGHLSGKTLVPPEEMVRKLRAATAARKDPNFVIIARTDARSVEGFDQAVERAKRYLDAGADALFPEALESEAEFADFARCFPGVPLLANLTEFGRSPALDRAALEQLGYRMVLYPVSGLRVALKAAQEMLLELSQKGHLRDHLPRMMTRRELYDLLDYEGYDTRDRAYFG